MIRLELDEAPGLRLEVEDDGHGIAAQHGSGVGLHSMRERAEELGGSFEIVPGAAGGTLVRACLPWRSHDGAQEDG